MSAVVQRNEETGFSQLYFQLQKLAESYDIPLLLIYGVYTPTKEGKVQVPGKTLSWSYSALELILFDAWAKGVYPVKVSSARAAALFIRALYAHSHGKGRKLELRKAKIFSYGGKPNAALALLCSLPDVNMVLGQRLLEKFGTPLATFNASLEELQEIDGIGKVKAKSIYECLRKETEDGRRGVEREANDLTSTSGTH